jgi:small conductance mechanosensitive channel
MPGKATPVARELRRRIKVALDENGIQVGTVSVPVARIGDAAARPSSDIAAPSALGDPNSAQSRAATAIAPTPALTDANTRQPGHEDGR